MIFFPYRMTILFFGVSGLDVLDGLSEVSRQDKADMVDWIYAQQILPNKSHSNLYQCGFRGGSFIGAPYQPTSSQVGSAPMCAYEKKMVGVFISCSGNQQYYVKDYASSLPPTHDLNSVDSISTIF